jgi:hypothetical protein
LLLLIMLNYLTVCIPQASQLSVLCLVIFVFNVIVRVPSDAMSAQPTPDQRRR